MLAVKVEGNKLTVTMTELQAKTVRNCAAECADMYAEAAAVAADAQDEAADEATAEIMFELSNSIAEIFPWRMT